MNYVSVADQLDEIEQRIMRGLKDFQKATVERIDYLYRNGQDRILVSDEVGLGKTLIARGTVAKLAKLRKEENDNLFKVVYVCSNAAIAQQNLQKLKITDNASLGDISSSRLSMQHLNIFNQEHDPNLMNQYIQLIPLTPDTSFRITSGTGTVQERALMYAILKHIPELELFTDVQGNRKDCLEIAMMGRAKNAWDCWCKDRYEKQVSDCDNKSNGEYLRYMLERLNQELNEVWYDDVKYRDALLSLCNKSDKCDRDENEIVSQLRKIFAKISIEKLEPDLVIMDEFQRFKYLINSDTDTEIGMLSHRFFNANSTTHKVRMLLLSATPYKMYSTPEEIDDSRIDEHYIEFLNVMNFLNENSKNGQSFMEVWKDYSVKLKEMNLGDLSVLAVQKEKAEKVMYQTVCRTERISEKVNADFIDDSSVKESLEVMEGDILSYLQIQKLVDDLGLGFNVPVDYIKSTPYILSFMRDYKLKRELFDYFRKHRRAISKINKTYLWLSRKNLNHYKPINYNNARLMRIMNTVLSMGLNSREQKNNSSGGLENLLWLPPSLPYYELTGVYKKSEMSTKTLIFSSWEMVPRMLSCLISYEVERYTVGKLKYERKVGSKTVTVQPTYFANNEDEISGKRYPPARMTFRDNQPATLNLFCLIYPSEFLANCYEPIDCLNKKLGIEEIKKLVGDKITDKLKLFADKLNLSKASESGKPDRRWLYLAPVLLDSRDYVLSWVNSYVDNNKDNNQKGIVTPKVIIEHIKFIKDLLNSDSFYDLGKMPEELVSVLTDMAIASPAICIYRSYHRYLGENEKLEPQLPCELARVFINRMNTPEATAVVERAYGKKSDDAHWRNLLSYCIDGNLQAVFDEYAHLLSNGLDRGAGIISALHNQMMESMSIRSTPYYIDTFNNFKNKVEKNKVQNVSMRSHFAVSFTKGDGDESDIDRKKILRNAFNSPFRPFVLASTSIGQEGLDFHNYCRRIVHWNLPSNPIDLEQREGRINRFECLAIRQNIAKRYGNIEFKNDVWSEMFDKANEYKNQHFGGSSDLIPYWGLPEREDMIKIERIVPMYPCSRDCMAYERLIKILSMYRLTLGQTRQQELLDYLFKNCDEPEKLRDLFINLSPYYKENKSSDKKL